MKKVIKFTPIVLLGAVKIETTNEKTAKDSIVKIYD